jgi:hypothetical protein
MTRHVLSGVNVARAASSVECARWTSIHAHDRSQKYCALKYGSKRTLPAVLIALAYALSRSSARVAG